jgi:hypothetical protein
VDATSRVGQPRNAKIACVLAQAGGLLRDGWGARAAKHRGNDAQSNRLTVLGHDAGHVSVRERLNLVRQVHEIHRIQMLIAARQSPQEKGQYRLALMFRGQAILFDNKAPTLA